MLTALVLTALVLTALVLTALVLTDSAAKYDHQIQGALGQSPLYHPLANLLKYE